MNLTDTAKAAAFEKSMKNNFKLFLWYTWKTINLPDPTPIQYDLANTLQFPPNRRFILQGFRGVAKSFITCAFAVWLLWRNPQLKIMIVSASKQRADANARFIRRLISEIEFLQHLNPNPGQVDTQSLFDVGPATPDLSPSVKSVGITGQITGSRADVIIADDVEIPSNSSTQTAREKLSELVKEFDAVIKPDEETLILYLGTPQNEQSLYNTLQGRGYKTLVWPARYPRTQQQRDSYGPNLAPYVASRYDADPSLAGTPTDPGRFSDSDLAEREVSYGRAGFTLQFMLDTSLSDADKYPLRLKDIIVASFSLESAPMSFEWLPGNETAIKELPNLGLKGDSWYRFRSASKDTSMFTGRVMAIDPAGRGLDATGYSVLYYLNGFLFLVATGGLFDGYSDSSLAQLAQVAKKYRVNTVTIESNFGDGMFSKLLEPVLNKVWPCEVVESRSKTQKEVRIADTLEPLLGSHKFVVLEDVIQEDYRTAMNKDGTHSPSMSLFHQMTRLTRERGALAHDDRLDSLAMAVKFFQDQMTADAEKGIESEKEDWFMAHMDDAISGYEDSMELLVSGIKVTWEADDTDLLRL